MAAILIFPHSAIILVSYENTTANEWYSLDKLNLI